MGRYMSHVETMGNPGPDVVRIGSFGACTDSVSLEDAKLLAAEHFGIVGQASRLTSERDQNFRIETPSGNYAFRVSNGAEDSSLNDLQTGALLHIAEVDPALPVPRVCKALNGEAHLNLPIGDGNRAVRMLSFLPGAPINTVARTANQSREMARILARLNLALRGYFHPAAGHELAWDVKNVSSLRPLLEHVTDPARKALAAHFLENFEVSAKPVLPSLRAQVVHNDLNIYNVLVDPADHDKIVGILDFGDMVFTSLAIDVAVGASFHMNMPGDPWDAAIDFIAAYHQVCPLEPAELDLMYDLIAARFVVTALITGWRAQRHPENSTYILKNNASAWRGLNHLFTLTREKAQSRLRIACNMEISS